METFGYVAVGMLARVRQSVRFLVGTVNIKFRLRTTQIPEMYFCKHSFYYKIYVKINPYFKRRGVSEVNRHGSYWLQINLTQWDASRRDTRKTNAFAMLCLY